MDATAQQQPSVAEQFQQMGEWITRFPIGGEWHGGSYVAQGDDRLRKGLPPAWKVGDKTGSNGETTTNDVAIVWPLADKPPLLIAAYLTECSGPDAKRNAVLAEVGRLVGQTRRT